MQTKYAYVIRLHIYSEFDDNFAQTERLSRRQTIFTQ